jgi:hypothetical protein
MLNFDTSPHQAQENGNDPSQRSLIEKKMAFWQNRCSIIRQGYNS